MIVEKIKGSRVSRGKSKLVKKTKGRQGIENKS